MGFGYHTQPLRRSTPVNNFFLNQFDPNIKFSYFCFDRVILRAYIRSLFFPAGVVKLLRALGFKQLTNGVMRILTDQLNGRIRKPPKRETSLSSA